MTLIEAVSQLASMNDDWVLCAKRPWMFETETKITELDEDLKVPADLRAAGFEYFLEVHIAKESLEVFGARKVNDKDKARLLIHYAENDAFPEWVYG